MNLLRLITARKSAATPSNVVMWLDAGNASSYPGSGTTWTDLSGNGNNATLVNGVGYSATNGGVLTFTNGSNRVDIATGVSVNTANPFTIEIWFYNTSYANTYPALFNLKSATSSAGFECFISQTGGYNGFNFGSSDSTWIRRYNNSNLNINQWYNLAITYNGGGGATAGNFKAYLNSSSQTLSNAGSYGTQANVGHIGYLPSGLSFIGNIAIVKLYNTELTATEVLNSYNSVKSRFGL